MLVLNRFTVPLDTQDGFVPRAHAALTALAERPGYLAGRLTRAIEDPDQAERWGRAGRAFVEGWASPAAVAAAYEALFAELVC